MYCEECIYYRQDNSLDTKKGQKYKCKLGYTSTYMTYLEHNQKGYTCVEKKTV